MISVIVPVYNCESSVVYTLESILRSDFQDLEILVIDDGSTDGSLRAVSSVRDAHPKNHIRVFSVPHRGVSAARNLGIAQAWGDRISFIDADDRVDASFFGRLNQVMSAFDADYVFCRMITETLRGESIPGKGPADFLCCENEAGTILRSSIGDPSALCAYRMGSACNGLFKKEIIEQNGLRFEESAVYGEDCLFMYDSIILSQAWAVVKNWVYRSGIPGITMRVSNQCPGFCPGFLELGKK